MLDIKMRSWIHSYEYQLFVFIYLTMTLRKKIKRINWTPIELYIFCVLLLRYSDSSDFYEEFYDSDIDIYNNQDSWVNDYDSDGRDLTDSMSYCFI